MKRKIIKQGHNTLTITLPSKWTKQQNIKAGDEITLIEKDHNLLLHTDGNDEEKTAEIDITNTPIPLLWRYMQGAYRAGCTDILITFDPHKKSYEDAYHYYTTQYEYQQLGEKVPSKPAVALIQEVVDRFIGIDIVETGKGFCRVREMARVTQKEYEQSHRRIFHVILNLFERIIYAIDNDEIGDAQICKEIHTIDLSIDKSVDYCARILNKVTTRISEQDKQLMFSSLFILELIGDEFKYLGKHLAETKKSVRDVKDLANMVQKHFALYYKLNYAFSNELALEFGENDKKVYATHFDNKRKFSGESQSMMRHFMMISKLTLALVELRIQQEF